MSWTERCCAVVLAAAMLSACSRKPRLPILGDVPEFALTDQNGQPFHGSSLDGRVWVADFIYTTCPGPCPLMSAKMKRILNRTGNGIHLVSFTVDPEHDLPPVLTAYAKRFGADPSRWSFLTGAHDELQRLNRNVFKLGDLTSTLEHSTRFVLVDAHRRIRAYYRMGDEDLIDRVVEDAKQLEREGS